MKNLDVIWDALCEYREKANVDDALWDEICTTMAWIEEGLNQDEWIGLTLP
jgi:hypothetical protein